MREPRGAYKKEELAATGLAVWVWGTNTQARGTHTNYWVIILGLGLGLGLGLPCPACSRSASVCRRLGQVPTVRHQSAPHDPQDWASEQLLPCITFSWPLAASWGGGSCPRNEESRSTANCAVIVCTQRFTGRQDPALSAPVYIFSDTAPN